MKIGLKLILFISIFVIFLVSQSSSESFKTDKLVVLNLHYNKGNLNLNKLNLQKGSLTPDKGDYNYKLYSKNKLIYSANFNIPLTLYEDKLDEKGNDIKSHKILKKTDFQLAIPYYKDVDKIKIYDKDNKLILSKKIDFKLEESTQNNCVTLIENGDQDIKINVVFVPDGYTDLNQFREDVLKHIDLNEQYQGILSREPLNENKNRFNFYYINEIFDYNCEYGCGNSEILEKASQCGYANQVIVLTDTTTYFGYATNGFAVAPGYTEVLQSTSFVTGPMVTSHEFGHSFSELADEYFSLYPISATYKANCDIASYDNQNPLGSIACPKWCSGPAIVPYTTTCSNFNEIDCKANSRTYNCVWLDQPDSYFGTQCIKAFDMTNIGTNCLEGTGCYLNCHGTNGFRATPSNCIMMSWKQDGKNNFCPICQNQIREVLSYYNVAPYIISKPVTIAIEDNLYSYQVNAIDRDDDILMYSLINAPEGMIISETGLISFTPNNEQIGNYFIKIEVKDNFEITIQNLNLKVISKYCEDNTLIGECSTSGSVCSVDETLDIKKPYMLEARNKPCYSMYCDYGDLKYYCDKCGYECPSGLICSNGECIRPKTSDNKFFNML